MAEIASAYISLIPSMKGAKATIGRELDGISASEGRRSGKRLGLGMSAGIAGVAGKMFAPVAAAAGGIAVAGLIGDSVALEASFSQTMATIGAATNTPKEGLKQLSDLAVKMGADTSFSANEASQAMLELAKGGLSAATIQSGALAGTLTLAEAGGTDLGTAATIASNALNTFGLRGKDMAAVAAALAGGANASTASVESLGEALSQVGPGAKNAGLSLQDTVGVLSAFDAAGVKGSDAGTSLKTMLTSLTPATDKAASQMKKLGLNFTDANGNFKSITDIAGQLNTKLKGLSQEQRQVALETMFGSDASRAATVLMNEGAAGIAKYIKATKDQGAAQKMAEARMSGTAGALERMKGAIETAKLQFGQFLAPAVVWGANALSKAIGALPGIIKNISAFVAPAVAQIRSFFASGSEGQSKMAPLVAFFNGPVKSAFYGIVFAVRQFLSVALPIVQQFVAGMMARIQPMMPQIKAVFSTIGQIVVAVMGLIRAVIQRVTAIIGGIWSRWGTNIMDFAAKIFKAVLNIIGGALKIIQGVIKTVTSIIKGDWSGAWDGIKQIVSGAWQAIKGIVSAALTSLKATITGSGTLLKDAMSWVGNKINEALSGLAGKMADKGRELIQGLIDGILDKIEDVKRAAGKVAKAVKDFFPGSPVKEGPLTSWNRGGAGKRLGGMLADGLTASQSSVRAASSRLASSVVTPVGGGVGAGGVGAGGLSHADVLRLAAAMSQVQVQATVSAGSFDRAMGAVR